MEISAIQDTSSARNDARWIGDLPDLPGVELLVRPVSSYAMTKAFGRAMRKAQPDEGELSEADYDRIDREVFSGVGLLDWRGITDGGEAVEFSGETAFNLMASDLFFAGVKLAAHRAGEMAEKAVADMAKNSSAPSKLKRSAA